MAGKDDPLGDRARIQALSRVAQADFRSRPPLARPPSRTPPVGVRALDYGPDPLGRPKTDGFDLRRYPQMVGPSLRESQFRSDQGAAEQPINFKPGYSLERLVREGRDLYADPMPDPSASILPYAPPNAPMAAAKWVRNVWPGGPWDFKKEGPQYEGFGNYAYGATGAALGIPDDILYRGAGAAQELFNWRRDATGERLGYDPAWGHFWQGGSHGDDPLDQISIQRGIRDAKARLEKR